MKLNTRSKRYSVTIFAMPDIAFLLLIFLIITASVDEYGNIELPHFKFLQEMESQKSVVLNISKTGDYGLRGEYYDKIEFIRLISEITSDSKIYLVADKDCPYRHVDQLLNILQEANLFDAVLVMDEYPPE